MMLLPPTNSVSSTSDTTSSWPTIALRSSAMIWSRPAFIRSASATSSGESRAIVSGASGDNWYLRCLGGGWRLEAGGWTFPVGYCQRGIFQPPTSSLQPPLLVRHRIHKVVHAELVRFVRKVHRRVAGIRPFPVFADVVVHVRNRDETLLRIVVLVDAPVRRRQPAVRRRERERIVDLEERVEDRMRAIELHPVPVREHAAHLRLQVLPIVPAEVVEDHEAALLEVRAEVLRLLVRDRPEARLRHVGDRI